MILNSFHVLISIFCVQVVAFYEFSNGQASTEMMEDGKNQYKLLQERGNLPQYGECWKSAIDHINEGCRYLTEDIQSDIALHITNCFLAMSGHDTYNCELDKKPNLRGICISSMTDRAFNVYTEFYTHAQNICWFLRGQVWQEKIAERTIKVGEQLKTSVNQQETLLKQQKESLTMQEQLLNYGKSLEKILNESRFQALAVMEEIRDSTMKHQKLLSIMTNSLNGLQSWLIGEISWFDSLVFYVCGSIIIVVITSISRTSSARLPLLFTLSANIIIERIICDKINTNHNSEIHLVHQDLYDYIWWCRQISIILCIIIIFVQAYFYQDYIAVNNSLLKKIQEQNCLIREELAKLGQTSVNKEINFDVIREKIESPEIKNKSNGYLNPSNSVLNTPSDYYTSNYHSDVVRESIRESPFSRRSLEPETKNNETNGYLKSINSSTSDLSHRNSLSNSSSILNTPIDNYTNNYRSYIHSRSSAQREIFDLNNKLTTWSDKNEDTDFISSSSTRRYNLRSRQDTPISNA